MFYAMLCLVFNMMMCAVLYSLVKGFNICYHVLGEAMLASFYFLARSPKNKKKKSLFVRKEMLFCFKRQFVRTGSIFDTSLLL